MFSQYLVGATFALITASLRRGMEVIRYIVSEKLNFSEYLLQI